MKVFTTNGTCKDCGARVRIEEREGHRCEPDMLAKRLDNTRSFSTYTTAEFCGGPYDGQRRELPYRAARWSNETGDFAHYYYKTFFPTPDGKALYWVWAKNHEES